MSSQFDLRDAEAVRASPAVFTVTFLLDPGGIITTWNPAIENLLLGSRDQWIGRAEETLLVSGDRERAAQDRERAAQDGAAPAVREYRRSDGTSLRAETTLAALFDHAGDLIGYSRTLQNTGADESESRFQLAAEAAQVGIWDYFPQSGLLRWDDTSLAAFGLPPGSPVDYDTFLTGIHPDDRTFADAAVQRALRGENGGEYAIEFRTIGLQDGGTLRWLAANGRAFFREDGEPERFIGTLIDITQRRRAEEALREREEYLRRVVESSPDCIKTMDLDGHILSMNEGGQQVMEVDDFPAICGIDWLTFWESTTRDTVIAALEAAKSGGTGRFQGFCPTLKGTPRWWDVVVAPLLGPDGMPEQLLGISRDITEQRLAAEQIAESEERFSALFERATVGITLTDLSGRFVLANDRYCQIVGRSQGELSTLGLLDLTYTDDRERSEAAFRHMIEMGEEFTIDTRLVRPDGSSLWVGSSLSLIRRRADEPLYIQVVSVDLTERKQAEEVKERLQQRERNIATQLQEALIPSEPSNLPGLTLASFYRPALVDEAGVGGDFFDVFGVEKECTALVVGDLSGKGLSAASQVAIVRNMLRYAVYTSPTLVAAISSLNRVLAAQELLTGFATLFVGAYDHEKRTLTYVNCGQEPGLIWRNGDGAVDELPPTGPVLGGFQEGVFREEVVSLAPGDVLALFTDGLTEVGPTRKKFLEVEGVSDLLRHCCAATAEQADNREAGSGAQFIRDSLIDGVDAFARNGIRDDIALLVGIIRDSRTEG